MKYIITPYYHVFRRYCLDNNLSPIDKEIVHVHNPAVLWGRLIYINKDSLDWVTPLDFDSHVLAEIEAELQLRITER